MVQSVHVSDSPSRSFPVVRWLSADVPVRATHDQAKCTTVPLAVAKLFLKGKGHACGVIVTEGSI
jgi:hypothetical protein